jgi:quercetin dioxygenase-like cupin family protein
MATIRFASREETPIMTVVDQITEEQKAALNDESLDSTVRFYHPGSETELQMFEVTVGANHETTQHAHDEAEIIYVVDGEMIVGSRTLRTGGSVYIPGSTLYSFRAGPNGLSYLNFRARQDLTYIAKDEFMARRAEAKARA